MQNPNDRSIIMEDVRIVFRNFAGRPDNFNPIGGKRTFSVLLPDDVAQNLEADGWHIKWLKPREEGDAPQASMKCVVKFGGRTPPRIVLVTSRGRNALTEDLVDMLDYADIKSVDLKVRPYDWEIGGKGGRTAYVQSLFAIIYEDALDEKYADLKEIESRFERDDDE